ncbi:MAG: dethiobiotin synthase [Flavobacteriales bacterium]|nr:dethiobiotin synthase [Flavobacteriales bacterium]
MERKIFITGIGTDVGKTLASAVLTEAWQADYWKPIQAGNLDQLESTYVQSLVSNSKSVIHPTQILLNTPCSPHYAAQLDEITIEPEKLTIPKTANTLLIEGAGGLMVPLQKDFLILDLIKFWKLPVVLVSRNYLGSVNHTLLTLEVLKIHQIPVLGLVFSDTDAWDSMAYISHRSQLPIIGHIPRLTEISSQRIKEVAASFQKITDL